MIASVRKLFTGVTHEYSTMYPGNINHLYFLLQHPHGFIGLHSADGSILELLPPFINTSSQPRWSRKKPSIFRYLYLNELREFDISTSQSTLIRKFNFPNINGMGESDTSIDDDHLILCSGQRVFIYEISTDRIFSEFNALELFNNLYLTANNLPIIGFYDRGVTIRQSGYYRTLVPRLCHMDTSSDVHGNPIMVWPDSTGKEVKLVLTRTDTADSVNLLSFDPSLAVHISLPDRAKFVIVTTYDPKNPSSAVKYANEILQVWLDSVNGSHVDSLGKHGSSADIYQRQPKASISPDGTRYVYDSNGSVYLGTIDAVTPVPIKVTTPIEVNTPMSNNASGITNPGVWSSSFDKASQVLDQPGSQTVHTIQAVVPYAGGTVYAVKQGIHTELVTYDNAPVASRDSVAINGVVTIAPGNLRGSGFSFTAITRVGMPGLPPADGYAVGMEVDIENYGLDQPDPDRPNSKYGFKAVAKGSANSSVAFEARGSTSPYGSPRWWRILFATVYDIVAGGKFIELYERFSVDGEGRVTLRNQTPPPPPPDGVTLFAEGGQLKAMKSNGQVIVYG